MKISIHSICVTPSSNHGSPIGSNTEQAESSGQGTFRPPVPPCETPARGSELVWRRGGALCWHYWPPTVLKAGRTKRFDQLKTTSWALD